MTNAANLILPTFIIGGAAKCATTSLHEYLGQHPDVCVSKLKELHFFDTDTRYAKGLGHYASYFSHHAGEKAIGESSPCYLHGRYIAERINKDLPGVKLLFLFRDPVKRAYSSYWHGYRVGKPMGTFIEAMDDPNCRHTFERSRYWKYLETYFEIFGRDRCLCLLTERLAKEPEQVMKEAYAFLGVDDSFIPASLGERENTHRMPRSMAIQRWFFRNVLVQGKPEDVSHYDDEGRLEVRKLERSFPLARRGIGWMIRRFNMKPAQYPPLSDEDAQRVRELYVEDNKRFAELTGLDIERWWPNA